MLKLNPILISYVIIEMDKFQSYLVQKKTLVFSIEIKLLLCHLINGWTFKTG